MSRKLRVLTEPTPNPPPYGRLIDRFGRVHTDLRVSVTDRCSLRCTYCMPAQGVPCLPARRLFSAEEIIRLVHVATNLGIETVRLTGGEPLHRPDLVAIVHALADLPRAPRLALTTNGLALARLAAPLAAAGLTRVNVSLDSLDRATYTALTRRDRLPQVLAGLTAARQAGLDPIKLNTVLIRGINDHEAPRLLDFALAHGYQLRFIEYMPLGPAADWDRTHVVGADEILGRLGRHHRLTPQGNRGSAPAERWLVDGGPGVVGIIAAVSRPFCADCARLRITADGQARACLFATEEVDIRRLLRSNASDEAVAAALRLAVTGKPQGHQIGQAEFAQPVRPMSAIGG